jgi:Sugar (and other) transporter
VLALFVIVVPRNLPESARWQIHARAGKEAEATIAEIEGDVAKTKEELSPVDPSRELEIRPTEQIGHLALLRTRGRHYPSRPGLGAALMITQSFLYNAIFFTYGLVLEFFFHVKAADTACYFMAFAAGNCWTGRFLLRLGRRLGRYLTVSGVFPLEVRAKAIAVFFVDAEGKSVEDVATPLSVIAKPAEAIFRSGGPGTDPCAGH